MGTLLSQSNKMSRSYTIRKMNGVEYLRRSMAYPYGCIGDEWMGYRLEDIRRSIPVEGEQADAGDFPKNIQEHFWIRPGENDGDSWMACGVLTNGNYFFYTGGCDYTGFDCQGGMSLWVSNSWQSIVDHAMSRGDYALYESQTAVPPVVAAGEEPWPSLTEQEFWAIQRGLRRCHECDQLGAENHHPYLNSISLCDRCFEGYHADRGSRWEEEEVANA